MLCAVWVLHFLVKDMFPTLMIDVACPATAAELAVVDGGIGAFNQANPALADVCVLHVLARDAQGHVHGGAIGRTWGQCCELQQLWVQQARRRQGIGKQLLARFEHEAMQRGCTLIYLETFSFQAPQFYAVRGYTVALQTHGFTQGVVKTTLHKRIAMC
jgi:GNAT superfamily N-acetyltransferase